jgi:hypothetical protein
MPPTLMPSSKQPDEIIAGKHHDHFPVDTYQTGSGTSSNMNMNEVLATLASTASGLEVHPNDHVNASQSSNDVFPTSVHVAVTEALVNALIPALDAPRHSPGGQGTCVENHGQGWSHPPDGRNPGDLWAKNLPAMPANSTGNRAGAERVTSGCRSSSRWHCNWHRH